MKKKIDSEKFRPGGSADVHETGLDLETGKRIDRKQAIKQWFKEAKQKTCSKSVKSRLIDPKQAVYGKNYSKRSKKNG